MIFHENRLLVILIKRHTLFFRKFRKMSQTLSSGAVVIGALRVNNIASSGDANKYKHTAQFK